MRDDREPEYLRKVQAENARVERIVWAWAVIGTVASVSIAVIAMAT